MATVYPLSSLAAFASKNSSKTVKHDQPFLNPILSQAVLFLMFPYLNLEITFWSSLLRLQQNSSISLFCCLQMNQVNLWSLLTLQQFYAFLKLKMQTILILLKISKHASASHGKPFSLPHWTGQILQSTSLCKRNVMAYYKTQMIQRELMYTLTCQLRKRAKILCFLPSVPHSLHIIPPYWLKKLSLV